ncbi:MAG: arylsulfatase A [Arenicella sp.]
MKKKFIVFLGLFAALIYFVNGALAPLDYGINRSDFEHSARDELDPSAVVKLTADSAENERPPNIIVILADDLGWGDIELQGSKAIQTPNINALAEQGVRLTNFYASSPICSPSRAALLTGRYPLRSGFASILAATNDTLIRKMVFKAGVAFSKLGMTDMLGGESITKGLPPSEITIPEALAIRGYKSLQVGKWHLGDFTAMPEYHPQAQGFDHSFGYNLSNDDWPVALWRDQQELVEDIGVDQSTHTREFTEEAVKYIKEWKDTPFFIYLAHKDPHQPFYPSKEFAGKSNAGPFGDAVSEFDWSVGEIMKTLQEQGIADNTLVIMTSDNGPWYEGSAGGLRGRKGQSYEGGFRVPFVAAWPGKIAGNSVIEEPAMNIDLLPTLLSIAGLNPPQDRIIDGINILPLMQGDEDSKELAGQRPFYFFHEYTVEAMRQGKWKYINDTNHYVWPVPMDKTNNQTGKILSSRDYYPPDGSDPVPTMGTWPLLYDMQLDPGESYNVTQHQPQVTARLAQSLSAWQKQFLEDPRGWDK